MKEPAASVVVSGSRRRECPVYVEPGLIERLGALVAAAVPAHRYVVVADGNVAKLHAERALDGFDGARQTADLLTFPPGEAQKSRATWADLTDRMLAAAVGRDAAVVALGGGVTGDLAGFTAATYMRGLPLVMVPTSLLAMLDSSIGGKTGVDAPGAKNVIGAFLHPRLVAIDPHVLSTLPARHHRAGLAEAVKIAAAADASLFDWIETHADVTGPVKQDEPDDIGGLDVRGCDGQDRPAALQSLIEACVRLKAGVVEEDPFEHGRRQILNFGHTAGHALEALSGFRLLHGEAVATGMRIEARLGEAAGVTEQGTAARIDAALDACGLRPGESLSGIGADELLDAAQADKKARRGAIRWVLLHRIGEVARGPAKEWSREIPGTRLASHLDAVLTALRRGGEVADSAS